MSDSERLKLKIVVSRLQRLAILQSSAIMSLSAAMLSVDGLSPNVRDEVFRVFSSLQEHIDVLSELKELNDLGDENGE